MTNKLVNKIVDPLLDRVEVTANKLADEKIEKMSKLADEKIEKANKLADEKIEKASKLADEKIGNFILVFGAALFVGCVYFHIKS